MHTLLQRTDDSEKLMQSKLETNRSHEEPTGRDRATPPTLMFIETVSCQQIICYIHFWTGSHSNSTSRPVPVPLPVPLPVPRAGAGARASPSLPRTPWCNLVPYFPYLRVRVNPELSPTQQIRCIRSS
mmetsp:Transcript_28691/g.29019  ORF Transcript_28691/g.29019 Transcript_28691/m.29019 type:complete len:128 (+) Transcript_28691:137-520(+)